MAKAMHRCMWRELGLPGPIRQRVNGKMKQPCRVYRIWQNMRMRCGVTTPSWVRNKIRQCGRNYWEGLTVCEEWNSFPNFYRWAMANGYRDDLTIDRIDWRKGYNPDNCRWATYSEQAKNCNRNTPAYRDASRRNGRLGLLALARKRAEARSVTITQPDLLAALGDVAARSPYISDFRKANDGRLVRLVDWCGAARKGGASCM